VAANRTGSLCGPLVSAQKKSSLGKPVSIESGWNLQFTPLAEVVDHFVIGPQQPVAPSQLTDAVAPEATFTLLLEFLHLGPPVSDTECSPGEIAKVKGVTWPVA
jgi:hypothetical protein